MRLVVFVSLLALSYSFPPPDPNLRQVRSAQRKNLRNLEKYNPAAAADYLGKFGYISKNRHKTAKVGGLIDVKSFSKAIKEFQRMAGLKPTGQLNRATIKMMSMSRCGVEDTVGAFMMGSNGNIANSKFRNKNQRRNTMRMKKAKRKKKKGKSRTKRYNLEGGRWDKSRLKYHILNYTPDMAQSQVKQAIKNAFNVWANYTTLHFSYTNNENEADLKISFGKDNHGDLYPFDGEVVNNIFMPNSAFDIWVNVSKLQIDETNIESEADIFISFVEGNHGDYDPFDGTGGTLAHAFFPSDGRAHFDEAELFSFNGRKGVDLFTVAAHEFGHSLGLAHSSVPNSLMAPFYQGYNPNFELHADDIAAIQQLYGKKVVKDKHKNKPVPTTTLRPKTTRPTKKPRVNAMKVCGKQVSFDSMHFNHRSGMLYAFKGIYYWKINDNGVLRGYPKRINRYWKGLPGNINAAVYSRTTGRTYFFKGSRVWRFDENKNLERGFPRTSSSIGLPSNPDAAMQWGRDGMIYVFKKNYFYQFSEYQRYDGSQRHPRKKMDLYWGGVPSGIDASIQWKNGKTFFFKGDKYWRFSGLGKPMDDHYPKSVKKFWLGCTEKTNSSQRIQTSKSKKKKNRRHNHQKSRKRKTSNQPKNYKRQKKAN